MKTARVKWVENFRFMGESPSGHTIAMDGPPEIGGENTAIRPGEMVLVALGGCTAIDVVSILKKMRVTYDSFEVVVDGEPADEFPKVWKKLHIRYIFKGKNIDKDKVKKAIELSEDKYCSVSAMCKKTADLTWELVVEEN